MEKMQSKMYDYICETPVVLKKMIENRKEITKEFVEHFKNVEIDQIYVIGSGTSYHAGVSAKKFLEEILGKKVFCMYPTQFARGEKVFNKKTLVIGMSQGGQSYSTVEGLDAAKEKGLYTAAVSENPTALIFEHAETKSLIVVGNEKCGAKTLFATHYHELTELEGKLGNVNNYCIAVKEKGDDIVFLRKIVKGGADKSYGIQVAKLAGLPEMVVDRAKEIVNQLSANDITETVKNISVETATATKKKKEPHLDEVDLTQMSLFDTVKDDDIIQELREVDISHMTPLDAMNKLYELQNKVKNRW